MKHSLANALDGIHALSTRAAASICLLLGAVLAWLDMALRLPLHLPGRRGLTQLALMVLAMSWTQRRWAASLTATSGMTCLWALRGDSTDSKAWFLLVAALVLDVGVNTRVHWRTALWWLALWGAAANGAQAVLKWLANLWWQDIGHGHGYWFFYSGLLLQPLFSHAVFGAVGALTGGWLWRMSQRAAKR